MHACDSYWVAGVAGIPSSRLEDWSFGFHRLVRMSGQRVVDDTSDERVHACISITCSCWLLRMSQIGCVACRLVDRGRAEVSRGKNAPIDAQAWMTCCSVHRNLGPATLVCYTLPRARCLKSRELPREVCGICYKCFDTLLVFFHRDRLERLAGASGLLADACGVRVPL